MLAERVADAAGHLRDGWNQAKIGLVLGSGWSALTEEVRRAKSIPYASIPHFPKPTVAGHHGELVLGALEEKPVAILSGRFHYYEGYSLQDVTFPVRVLASLGVKTIILTNAAGGLDAAYEPGDMMAFEDHLNMMPDNPLRGAHEPVLGERFVSLASVYDPSLRAIAVACGKSLGIRVHEGIYLALSGPTYETPAEIRMFRAFGATAVGMSTVPEAIVARQAGLSVLAISLITNVHRNGASPSHAEVLDEAKQSEKNFKALLKCVVSKVPA